MSKAIQNSLYVVAEDIGSLAGLLAGAINGAKEVVLIHDFVRERLRGESEKFFVEYSSKVSQEYQGHLRKEFATRFLKRFHMMMHPSASVARWAFLAGIVVDWSDGKPDNLGYLTFVTAANLLYRGGRSYLHRHAAKQGDKSHDVYSPP